MTIFLRGLIAFISGIFCLYLLLLNMPSVTFYFSPMHDPLVISQAIILLAFFAIGFVTSALIVYLGMRRSFKSKLAAKIAKMQNEQDTISNDKSEATESLLPPQ